MSLGFSGSQDLSDGDPLAGPEPQSRLLAWLVAALPECHPELKLRRFRGGQSNPSYLLSLGDARFVLRCKPGPASQLLPSAHAIEREYRVLKALQGTDVPTAVPVALCQDESVVGRAFYLMSFVPGQVHWDPRLPELGPEQRRDTFFAMNRVLASIHGLDPAALGLSDFAAPGHYYDRQIGRWTKQYRAAEGERIDAMESLIDWLPRNQPPAEHIETRLLHGDFRLDNMIFDTESTSVRAVLDWELATLGDPLAELAYNALAWYTPTGAMRGLAGVDLATQGIPSLSEYRERYEAASGRQVGEYWHFYLAYNLFRLASIMQGVAARARQGTAASQTAREQGALAAPAAELGWALAQRSG